jgi:hypothetical protein
MILELLNSETLELSWNIEPNRIQSKRIEFSQYFDVFSSSIRLNRTQKDIEKFLCVLKVRFGRRKNS